MKQKSKLGVKLGEELKVYDNVTKIPTNKIIPNNWNPNVVPEDIIDAIRDDMIKNGFVRPILLQKHNKSMNKSNVIIDGETRYKVFKELGGKEIPAIIVDIPDNNARALTIRLNREHGEMLPNRIGDVLLQISKSRDVAYLQDITQMKEKDIEMLINMHNENIEDILDEDKGGKGKNPVYKTKATKCPSCGHEFVISSS